MEFGVPDWIAQQRVCCVTCKKDFVPINEEACNEIRCIDCQTAFRIANAANPRRTNSWNTWKNTQPFYIQMKLGITNVQM